MLISYIDLEKHYIYQNTNKESENTDWHVTWLPQIYCRKYKDIQHRIKLTIFLLQNTISSWDVYDRYPFIRSITLKHKTYTFKGVVTNIYVTETELGTSYFTNFASFLQLREKSIIFYLSKIDLFTFARTAFHWN